MFNKDHYVPIIRWKRGEQTALIELDQEIKNGMTPLIEIPPIDWDFENECFKKSIDDHLKNFATQIKTSWNNPNKLFIDAFQICIDDDDIMANGSHPLEYIFHLLSEEKIEAIPVTSKNRGTNYQKAINSVLHTYNTGFAIRLTDEEFDDIDSNISWFVDQFDCSPAETDIFIDYKYIDSKSPVGRMAKLVAGSLLSLPHINQWRTLTFAATTFPENLSEFSTGTDGNIPRNEWLIYQRLLKTKLPRYPAFGDYIISNPEYSKIDPRLMRMSANIRYTADDEYLIFRGFSVTSPKYGKWTQTQGLCQRVVGHSKYSGSHYSYGDKYIYDCANGSASTGNAERWRKVGTNHHLTLVRNELSNFHATLAVGSQ
ncbi:beta family protein [Peribacillus sp. RS7]|uniref:beta family protein n=1 Tax=Peribacillus sp. RS7 TaxID=3242679 RepID=UPI0035BFE0FE